MDYVRQLNLIDPSQIGSKSISLVGVGATGSFVAMNLAQMGWGDSKRGQGVLRVFDGDTVEEHNLANQIYGPEHIGMPKVEALKSVIREKCGFEIEANNEMVTDQKEIQSTYVFLLTDTMSSREEVFDKCLRFSFNTDLVIETRMGLRDGRVYAFNPNDHDQVAEWKSTLYTDKEADVSLCGTSSSIVTTVSFIASMATGRVIEHFDSRYGKKHLTGGVYDPSKNKMWNEIHFSLYPESFYMRRFNEEPVIAA